MSRYHITRKTKNKKTGSVIVITSSRDTCPNACPFRNNGCYADGGPLRVHWEQVTVGNRGMDFEQLLCELQELDRWRAI